MRSTIRLIAPVLAGAAALASLPAMAQDTSDAAQPSSPAADIATGGDSLTIAVGAATVPSYEGSDKNRIIPAAAIRGSISGINFSTRGARLFVDLVPNASGPGLDFQLGPVVGVNTDRTSRKSIDDKRVEALGKRDTAIELGGYVGIARTGVITSDYDTLGVSVAYTQDVNKAHKSYLITPQINYGTPLSRKAFVGLSVGATYVGGEYADTYFSVTPAGSLASTLPTYNAGKGWKNYSVSALATYSLTGDLLHGLSLVAGGSYSKLLNDFADSPVTRIAGDRDQLIGAVGLAYTF
ncbi:MipA/OmpV family protein [Sphingomonas endolithica]|uniref:MipA/OmpV family protein n=1 Tax=Sphingomonas endolithica TaxID=2972485 RepID=UPI0021B02F0A|nr:MipA/OmpV family protein [Sphingomonas sp. ZFBP2030]